MSAVPIHASEQHPVQCWCGTFKAVLLNPGAGNRVVCYCGDCQAFAHALGKADQVLDERGGSDIVQVLPRNITVAEGKDVLACLRLTPRGLLRWYTSCCDTPIGNTLASSKLSFIGLLHACLSSSGRPLDETFGPVRAWVHTKGALGDPKPREAGRAQAAGWFFRTILKARFNGDYRRTPLFQEAGDPIVTPHILSDEELEVLRERCSQWGPAHRKACEAAR
jgi:hypothetical protein